MNELERLQALIAKLPLELQTYGQHYVELLLRFQEGEISAIFDQFIRGDILLAYKMALSRMTNNESLAELDRLNTVLVEQNKEALAEGEYLKNLFRVAIAIGIVAL